ncbi:DesA family fatty acid desaturase [Chitinimonas sp. BJB300]|uniref:DesA family fatty acid desaturase n=1 Tax=Chitinimonas sp. BJB300 TaxID=1559339 RepID=UPI000C0C7A9C|nr:fatty acid desaturase [Chitinimonas sp. BJB300]PHV09719.1 acyl-CoA desaturase [Chitinimonas sp. BJB300]TSJ91418.1 acyl-CoA desaturase [Chitinimonas sp. BJB300]
MLSWLNGLIDLPWWGYIVVALGLTHITIASVTIFLHRHQAHRALDLHPIPSHFFRFWLWLTTGMVTKEWASIHRKHHAKCESLEDPHSPQVLGIKKVFFEGAELYRAESKNKDTMEKYGHGTPDDWIERNVYSKHSVWGVVTMAVVNLLLFGVNGIWIWAVQMVWIPLTAAGIINGIGHYWGYRNFENEDASTNIVPWGILIGGEELHNNHHTFGTSAKLSNKWFEFDIGWMYIRILEMLGLAKVRRVAPAVRVLAPKPLADLDTLQAIIANRYEIASAYARQFKATVTAEVEVLRERMPNLPNPQLNPHSAMKRWLKQDRKDTPPHEQASLDALLAESKTLDTIYRMRQELTVLWERSSYTKEQLLKQLQDWCVRAEASGIEALRDFSLRLRSVELA